MRSRPDVARAEPHPGRQTGHLESERLEDRGEERILFKAIPASRPSTSFACSDCKSSEIGRLSNMSRFSNGILVV